MAREHIDCSWGDNDRRKHCELVIELKGEMQNIKSILEREKIDRHEWRENINISITNLERDTRKIIDIANKLYYPYKIIILVFVGLATFLGTKMAEYIGKIISSK